DSFGGGHAHVGMMIYLGNNWPAEYRGHLFTVNMHGRRANQEILERRGSGYVGRHGSDFFFSSDPWFRGMELSYGPDGGVFVLDWSDTGECHESTGVHRTSGRIYKITYEEKGSAAGSAAATGASPVARRATERFGEVGVYRGGSARASRAVSGALAEHTVQSARAPTGAAEAAAAPDAKQKPGEAPKPAREARAVPVDLAKLSASELVKFHTNANEWFTRQARLELAARAETGRGLGTAKEQLREMFEKQSDVVVKLRAFWSLYTIGAVDEAFLRAQLRHPNEHVRTWAIRFLTDRWPLDTVMSQRPGGNSEIRNPKSETEQSLLTSSVTLKEFVRAAKT